MYTGLKHLHLLMVILFVLSLVIKTVLLFVNKDKFAAYKQKTKIPEMITTIVFLITGIIMIVLKDAKFSSFLWIKLSVILVAIPLAIVGFKKQNKILALIGTLLFVGIYGLAEMAKKRPYMDTNVDLTQISAGSIQHGEELYSKNCKICHGAEGDMGLGGASNLKISTLTDTEIVNVISNGRGNMAAYKQLNDQDLEALKNYLITLRK
jgi:uncharacterized membrane protein SirB2